MDTKRNVDKWNFQRFVSRSWYEYHIERVKATHGIKLYIPSSYQTAWTSHPHHVSFSGSLWVDLAMVGVIYRLDEMFFSILVCRATNSIWIAYVIYLAIFDSFESLLLIQAEYQTKHGVSTIHSFLQLASWLFLALMGASIPNDFPCAELHNVVLVTIWFPLYKLIHSLLRLIVYLEIYYVAGLKDAFPRLVSVFLGVLPLIASLVLAAVGQLQWSWGMFALSFLIQRLVYVSLKMKFPGGESKLNIPFVIQRYRDWVQLQLGSAVLGLVTTNLDIGNLGAYFLISAAYLFLAVLDLFSYTSDPKQFHDHALIHELSWHGQLWFSFLVCLGLGFLGVAVGIRFLLKAPYSVDEIDLIWPTYLLVVSTAICLACILLQMMTHEHFLDRLRTRKRVWILLFLLIGTCVIATPIIFATSQFTELRGWVPFNLFCSTGAMLIVHGMNGGFQKELSKREHRRRFHGTVMAFLVGKKWLERARKRLKEKEREREQGIGNGEQVRLPRLTEEENEDLLEKDLPLVFEEKDDVSNEEVGEDEGNESFFVAPTEALPILSSSTYVRVLKKVAFDKFYMRTYFLVPFDVFSEYMVRWSDLFTDILYVALTYRLGYYLANGLHLSHKDSDKATTVDANQDAETIFEYACLYVAVFHLWFSKLNFSSKCGVNDVFHKIVDIFLGYMVLLCALSITSPTDLANSKQSQYWISGTLGAYHFVLLLLWIEVSWNVPLVATRIGSLACAQRNIKRELLSLLAVGLAFFSTATNGALVLTYFFWFCTYAFPWLQRLEEFTRPWGPEAPFLLRYVLHRVGDASLLVLGEGVLQVIRAVHSFSDPSVYLTFTLAFLNLTLCRIALFQMDCLDDNAKKHAVLQDLRRYHFWINTVRILLSGPAIIAFGVGMKLLLDHEEADRQKVFELAGISASICMLSFTMIYHLHRTAYLKAFDVRSFLVGVLFSVGFLVFVWIPQLSPDGFAAGLMAAWLVTIGFHGFTDDFLVNPIRQVAQPVFSPRPLSLAQATFQSKKRRHLDSEHSMKDLKGVLHTYRSEEIVLLQKRSSSSMEKRQALSLA